MNLHEWITTRVGEVEYAHRSVVFVPKDGGLPIGGTITGAERTADGVELTVAQYGPDVDRAGAILRRCDADRRILARHKMPIDGATWSDATMCIGCGTYSDCDWATTENINDCPELLDLAHAHGITPEELAALDRPERPPQPAYRPTVTAAITTDQIPEALRGPRWGHHR